MPSTNQKIDEQQTPTMEEVSEQAYTAVGTALQHGDHPVTDALSAAPMEFGSMRSTALYNSLNVQLQAANEALMDLDDRMRREQEETDTMVMMMRSSLERRVHVMEDTRRDIMNEMGALQETMNKLMGR